MELTGLSIIGESVMVDTLHIAKMTKRKHHHVIEKFKTQFVPTAQKIGAPINWETSKYIDTQGKEQKLIIMNSDTATLFLSTFTKSLSLKVISMLMHNVNELKKALSEKDKEAKALVARYRLTDTIDCSNLSSICGRFDLTPQKANKILCDRGILKRIKNGNILIYRLTAGYLGKGICNIDQDTDDLKTHLKWTDKAGIAFLTTFFEIEQEKERIKQREIELRNHPVLPGIEDYI